MPDRSANRRSLASSRRHHRSGADWPGRAWVALVLGVSLLAGCTGGSDLPPPGGLPVPGAASGSAPSTPYQVVRRAIEVQQDDFILPTVLFYPVADDGTFPLVVFGHGLGGLPDAYQPLLERWAAAGFVVAAPVFPETNATVREIDRSAVLAQDGYVSMVLDFMSALSRDDSLYGRVDVLRAAVAGHSAGGRTALGVLSDEGQHGRDERFIAAVVLAGNAEGVGQTFIGDAASVMFVHTQGDPVVSYASARAAYAAMPWPRAFLALPGSEHTKPYTDPADEHFAGVAGSTVEFLRWTLYFDKSAQERLAKLTGVELAQD